MWRCHPYYHHYLVAAVYIHPDAVFFNSKFKFLYILYVVCGEHKEDYKRSFRCATQINSPLDINGLPS